MTYEFAEVSEEFSQRYLSRRRYGEFHLDNTVLAGAGCGWCGSLLRCSAFNAWVHARDYAYVQREAAVRIGKASEGAEERHEAGPRTFLMYVDVQDVAAVVAEVRPRLLAAGMAGGDGPVDQTWGQREFWVRCRRVG